jgi:hypothetical protein
MFALTSATDIENATQMLQNLFNEGRRWPQRGQSAVSSQTCARPGHSRSKVHRLDNAGVPDRNERSHEVRAAFDCEFWRNAVVAEQEGHSPVLILVNPSLL